MDAPDMAEADNQGTVCAVLNYWLNKNVVLPI